MNNFHIYEEVGRGKDSVVYKVSESYQLETEELCDRVVKRRLLSMLQSNQWRSLGGRRFWMR